MDSIEIMIDYKVIKTIKRLDKEPFYNWKDELKQYIQQQGLNKEFEDLISEKVIYQIMHKTEKGQWVMKLWVLHIY